MPHDRLPAHFQRHGQRFLRRSGASHRLALRDRCDPPTVQAAASCPHGQPPVLVRREHRPAPLDERIARLYYGRAPNGRAMASPSKPRSHTPSNEHERRMQELHSTGTITSVLRSVDHTDSNFEGGGLCMQAGSVSAQSTNAFASSLRKTPEDAAGLSHPTQDLLSRVVCGSSMEPDGWRSSHGLNSLAGSDDFTRSRSPSSLSRPLSLHATSVGSHESPPKPVAFGSGRPQRPDSTTYTGSASVPAIGSGGDVQGVF